MKDERLRKTLTEEVNQIEMETSEKNRLYGEEVKLRINPKLRWKEIH